MSKVAAKFLIPGKRQRQDVDIILPEQLFNFLEKNNYTIEIVDLENNIHTVYICDKDVDILSVSFNPRHPENVKHAFKKICDRLLSIKED